MHIGGRSDLGGRHAGSSLCTMLVDTELKQRYMYTHRVMMQSDVILQHVIAPACMQTYSTADLIEMKKSQ